MPKSSKRAKPSKPYPEFLLTANGNGQWAKVIRGRPHYFGMWEHPDAARDLYLEHKEDLQAGRSPKQKGDSVHDLRDRYMAGQDEKLKEP